MQKVKGSDSIASCNYPSLKKEVHAENQSQSLSAHASLRAHKLFCTVPERRYKSSITRCAMQRRSEFDSSTMVTILFESRRHVSSHVSSKIDERHAHLTEAHSSRPHSMY